jgi:hypothetical protein
VPTLRAAVASGRIASCDEAVVLHASALLHTLDSLYTVLDRLHSGRLAFVVPVAALEALAHHAAAHHRHSFRRNARKALKLLQYELQAGRVILATVEDQLAVRNDGGYADADTLPWDVARYLLKEAPLVKPRLLINRNDHASHAPQHLTRRVGVEDFDRVNWATPGGMQKQKLSAQMNRYIRQLYSQRTVKDPVGAKATLDNHANHREGLWAHRASPNDRDLKKMPGATAVSVLPGHARNSQRDDFRYVGVHTPHHAQ